MRRRVNAFLSLALSLLVGLSLLSACTPEAERSPAPTATPTPSSAPTPTRTPVPEPTGPERLEELFTGVAGGTMITAVLEQDGERRECTASTYEMSMSLRHITTHTWSEAEEEPWPPAEEEGGYWATISGEDEQGVSWSLSARSNADDAILTIDGETYYLRDVGPSTADEFDTVAYDLKTIYCDLELANADGRMEPIIVADTGQDYLTAAEEAYRRYEEVHLNLLPGGCYTYSFVKCSVSPNELITNDLRTNYSIPDDETWWGLDMETIFVPENDSVMRHDAGNTLPYDGEDPEVPEGAYIYFRQGTIAQTDAGWKFNCVGTGW